MICQGRRSCQRKRPGIRGKRARFCKRVDTPTRLIGADGMTGSPRLVECCPVALKSPAGKSHISWQFRTTTPFTESTQPASQGESGVAAAGDRVDRLQWGPAGRIPCSSRTARTATGRRVLMLDNGGDLARVGVTLAYRIEERGEGPRVEWLEDPLRSRPRRRWRPTRRPARPSSPLRSAARPKGGCGRSWALAPSRPRKSRPPPARPGSRSGPRSEPNRDSEPNRSGRDSARNRRAPGGSSMHAMMEGDPHRLPPDSIHCQPQGVAMYGKRGNLWRGRR